MHKIEKGHLFYLSFSVLFSVSPLFHFPFLPPKENKERILISLNNFFKNIHVFFCIPVYCNEIIKKTHNNDPLSKQQNKQYIVKCKKKKIKMNIIFIQAHSVFILIQ